MNLKFLRLPGSYNYKSTITHPLTIKSIQFLLGPTFYPRISHIYHNTLQSISSQNYSYLSSSMSSKLSSYLISKRSDMKDKSYRIKIHRPNKIIIPNYNRKRDKMWKSQNIAIGVESNVYFGMEFVQSNPLNQGKKFKIIKTGPHRYFYYDKEKNIFENIYNLYQYQTYEFKIKIVSSTHMKIMDAMNKQLYLDDEKDQYQEKGLENHQKQIETQMVMRTGNSNFNWVVIDINGIMANRGKV